MAPAAGPLAPGPAVLQALRRHWRSRPLALQAWLVGAGASLAGAVLLGMMLRWTPLPSELAAWPAWPWAVLAGGMVSALAVALWARTPAREVGLLTDAARALRRDDAADDMQLPPLHASREWQAAGTALRRMVDAHRAQRQALQQRIGQLGHQLQQRTHELSTLQDLSIGLAQSTDILSLVDEALQALERTLDYTSASVWSRDRSHPHKQVVLMGYRSADSDAATPDLRGQRLSRANLQLYEQIERSKAPHIDNHARQGLLSWLWAKVTDDARTSSLYRATRSWMGLPLQVRDQVLGVLRVDHRETGYFDPARARLLGAVSSQTALAMHHSQLMLQERELAVVAERNRIARELHDAVSQTLFAANVIAGTLASTVERDGLVDAAALARQVRSLEQLNRGALAEMRMLLFELRPDALEGQSLLELLRHPIEALACRGDIAVHADIDGAEALPNAQRQQIYRIAQEAMTNLARHSGASEAWVQWLPDDPDGPTLEVRDNGQGFDTSAERPGHFGMDNMRVRAEAIGASLTVRSQPGAGTEIRVTLPRHTPQPSTADTPAILP